MQYLTVAEVAEFMEVSPQYVRVLLSQGRIRGFKDSFDIWRIMTPFCVRPGKRGRALKADSKVIYDLTPRIT